MSQFLNLIKTIYLCIQSHAGFIFCLKFHMEFQMLLNYSLLIPSVMNVNIGFIYSFFLVPFFVNFRHPFPKQRSDILILFSTPRK